MDVYAENDALRREVKSSRRREAQLAADLQQAQTALKAAQEQVQLLRAALLGQQGRVFEGGAGGGEVRTTVSATRSSTETQHLAAATSPAAVAAVPFTMSSKSMTGALHSKTSRTTSSSGVVVSGNVGGSGASPLQARNVTIGGATPDVSAALEPLSTTSTTSAAAGASGGGHHYLAGDLAADLRSPSGFAVVRAASVLTACASARGSSLGATASAASPQNHQQQHLLVPHPKYKPQLSLPTGATAGGGVLDEVRLVTGPYGVPLTAAAMPATAAEKELWHLCEAAAAALAAAAQPTHSISSPSSSSPPPTTTSALDLYRLFRHEMGAASPMALCSHVTEADLVAFGMPIIAARTVMGTVQAAAAELLFGHSHSHGQGQTSTPRRTPAAGRSAADRHHTSPMGNSSGSRRPRN